VIRPLNDHPEINTYQSSHDIYCIALEVQLERLHYFGATMTCLLAKYLTTTDSDNRPILCAFTYNKYDIIFDKIVVVFVFFGGFRLFSVFTTGRIRPIVI